MIKPIDLINCISVFQLAFFSFYIIHKGRNSLSNRLLTLFFIAQLLALVNFASLNIFWINRAFSVRTAYIAIPVWFLWGPFMYLYVVSQVNKSFSIKPAHLLHFVPFLLVLVYLTVTFYAHSYPYKLGLLNNGLFQLRIFYCSLGMNVQVFVYNFLSLLVLFKYQKALKNFSSSVEKQNLTWLKTVLFGYVIACIVSEFFTFFGNRIPISNELKDGFIYFSFLLFFNVLFYKAIINPYVFIEIEPKIKPNTTNISELDFQKYVQLLESNIDSKKPFLNPSLTLKDLAIDTGIGERIISQIINQYYKKNFFAFINSYRIEEAKKLITSNKIQNSNMLGIAYDAGFNSKTVFYDAFKKVVGMTPTEYRQRCA